MTNGVNPVLMVEAEHVALETIYQFRLRVTGASPEAKLLAAKALLGKLRTMVEDLEQSVPSRGVQNNDNTG